MNRMAFVIAFVLLGNIAFAQKDTTLYYIPLINNKIVYKDSIDVPGRKKAELDAAAKKWFFSYFKMYKTNLTEKSKDPENSISDLGIMEFSMTPRKTPHQFYLVTNIDINCHDNNYSYKISYIYIRPKGGIIKSAGCFAGSSETLVNIYNKKRTRFFNISQSHRKMIASYLANIDANVRNCISSLNKAIMN
jgi:hypothetical protein